MTWTAPAVERADPLYVADERTSLQDFLDYHRQTLRWKCSGLTGDQLAARPIPGSSLSLLGLVRHLSDVQRVWLRVRVAGPAGPGRRVTGPTSTRTATSTWLMRPGPRRTSRYSRAECDAADAAVAGRSLDDTFLHERQGIPDQPALGL